jgi:hypothetical protein
MPTKSTIMPSKLLYEKNVSCLTIYIWFWWNVTFALLTMISKLVSLSMCYIWLYLYLFSSLTNQRKIKLDSDFKMPNWKIAQRKAIVNKSF